MRFILTILFVGIMQLSFAQPSTFTKAEIVEDLAFLKQELIENHPSLYTYSTEKEVDAFFEKLALSLPQKMTETEVHKIISSVSQIIKDGHSYVYPTKKRLEMFYNSSLLFPLDVFWNDEKLYVLQDLTAKQNIPIGSEIQSINGISAKEIYQTIAQNLSRDGDNMAYPNFLFHEFFPAYYSFFYGFQDEFTIDFLTENDSLETIKIGGLTRNKRRERKKIYYPESLEGSITNPGISTWNHQTENYVILKIQSFENKGLKTYYQQKFKKEIKKAFEGIERQNVQNLVIDLRGNQGGEVGNGVYLLQHILREPFQTTALYQKIQYDKTTKTRSFKQIGGKIPTVVKPKTSAFKGKVFLLVDGGSYSCSAIVANAFQQENRGKIIGTMTGGSAFLNSGSPDNLLELSNSKVQFTIPSRQFVLQNTPNIEQGVKPDYEVQTTMKAILENKDLHIEQVKKLIQE